MKYLVDKIGEEEKFPEIVKNWQDSGLLWFIDKKHGEELAMILEAGARMIVHSQIKYENSSTLFFPALTRIYMSFNAIRDTDSLYQTIKQIPEGYEASKKLTDILKDDIQIILTLLEEYATFFMPLGERYLNHIDYEAELLKDFCENYCTGRLESYKKEIGV